ncbi:chloride channel [Lipomyces oligophaga]|uniref:chloride channel n=1 Tax=Lipomyces oligophaga TaxID=45792 RepID=UPI0034CD8CBC
MAGDDLALDALPLVIRRAEGGGSDMNSDGTSLLSVGGQSTNTSHIVRADFHSPGVSHRVIHSSSANPQNHTPLAEIFAPSLASASDSSSSLALDDISDDHASATASVHSERTSGGSVDGSTEDPSSRTWYDDYTTIDWVHDFIKESVRVKLVKQLPGIRGRLLRTRYAAQGWILVSVIGATVACIAYLIESIEMRLFDWRSGFCSTSLFATEYQCCDGSVLECSQWIEWKLSLGGSEYLEYALYVASSILLASLAVILTLTTATRTPYLRSEMATSIPGFDTNASIAPDAPVSISAKHMPISQHSDPEIMYTAAGGGIVQVKTILSGFIIKRFLGSYTLLIKSISLILAISSGLNVGKEGPYVHMAACVGNVTSRLFAKFRSNDGKRREIISAATAAGVAVAFGSPLGGVIFALEEVSYYFPQKTLFRSFLCAAISALVLKLLNPYGTGKIVIFEVSYSHDWHTFEFFIFLLIGVCGGAIGAVISALSLWWNKKVTGFRSQHPIFEVVLMAAVTASISQFNVFTKKAPTELLYDLTRQCDYGLPNPDILEADADILCPRSKELYPAALGSLVFALIVKLVLTSLSTGLTLPAGLYVPSMVIGALYGRMIGLLVEIYQYHNPMSFLFSSCPAEGSPNDCVIAGVYALVGAGAVMAGVTRMTVTLAVILFEITGSLDHVLPISFAILIGRWVAHLFQPESMYDKQMHDKNFPFLDNTKTPGFSGTLHDIVPYVSSSGQSPVIDISATSYISPFDLRMKLRMLQVSGERDGSLPIIRYQALVGLIPAPELEYALDRVKERVASSRGTPYQDLVEVEDIKDAVCYLSVDGGDTHRFYSEQSAQGRLAAHWNDSTNEPEASSAVQISDLSAFIDRAPISLDINSPLAMVYLMFVKMGLRMVCVLEDGKFWGVLHKKSFIEYCRYGDDSLISWL